MCVVCVDVSVARRDSVGHQDYVSHCAGHRGHASHRAHSSHADRWNDCFRCEYYIALNCTAPPLFLLAPCCFSLSRHVIVVIDVVEFVFVHMFHQKNNR